MCAYMYKSVYTILQKIKNNLIQIFYCIVTQRGVDWKKRNNLILPDWNQEDSYAIIMMQIWKILGCYAVVISCELVCMVLQDLRVI